MTVIQSARISARFVAAICLLWLAASSGIWGADATKPNVVYVVIDNVTFEHMGQCFEGQSYTPVLDRIAAEGVAFDRMYVPTAICVPSRYSILTGRYPERCTAPQILAMSPADEQWQQNAIHLEADRPNIAKGMKDAGYTTGYVGKFHVHHEALGEPYKVKKGQEHISNPEITAALASMNDELIKVIKGHGFDYVGGAEYGNGIPIKGVDRDGVLHNLEWEIEHGLEFIDQQHDSGKPFFLYLSTQLLHLQLAYEATMLGDYEKIGRYTERGMIDKAPEVPMLSRREIVERAREHGPDEEQAICMHWLDTGIGAVIARLEQYGVLDNTIVIVLSDNNQPGKDTVYEGGVHVPAVMMWKKGIDAGQRIESLVSSMDIVPTLYEAAGRQVPADELLDGRSFLPLLQGRPIDDWRESFLVVSGHARGVVTKKWKYVAVRYPEAVQKRIDAYDASGKTTVDLKGNLLEKFTRMEGKFHPQQKPMVYNKHRWHFIGTNHLGRIPNYPCIFDLDQLYDLEQDPDEQHNLAADPAYADTVKQMQLNLRELLKPMSRPFGEFK